MAVSEATKHAIGWGALLLWLGVCLWFGVCFLMCHRIGKRSGLFRVFGLTWREIDALDYGEDAGGPVRPWDLPSVDRTSWFGLYVNRVHSRVLLDIALGRVRNAPPEPRMWARHCLFAQCLGLVLLVPIGFALHWSGVAGW